MRRAFDPIELEICWQSLIATVNEQAKALQRSAFSPIVREAGDLANAVFDRRGRMVAQAVTGTPGHINSLAMGVANILDEYPVDALRPGDVLITNDPYKTAGQLLDVTVLVPVWRGGGAGERATSSGAGERATSSGAGERATSSGAGERASSSKVIALFGSTIHHTDVGGYGIGAGGRDVFEEGLWIPIVKLMREGERNDDVWKFILSNVRQPDHMAGDLHAQMASGEVGAQRLLSLCDQHGLEDIEDLADEIIERSETATRTAIRALDSGTYDASAILDLADGSRIEIVCALTVDADSGTIVVDYTGSSPASPWGINVVRNYTHAYTTFTVRSVLSPEIPNNHGSLAPIEMVAPEGTIVNAVSPQPGTARHVVGMFLPNALLKALAQVRPDAAMAEGSGAVWTMQVSGNHDDGSPFITAMFTYAGGVGARATKPGLDACSYPTGVAAVPIEVVEASAPIRFTRKALRPGSGGAGRQTGGLGQTIEFTVDTRRPWLLNAVTSRLAEAPQGIFGGEPGSAGRFSVNGEPVTTQARMALQPGDTVRLDLPGGGGYGPPTER
jgi:N-methylhydantoinase B